METLTVAPVGPGAYTQLEPVGGSNNYELVADNSDATLVFAWVDEYVWFTDTYDAGLAGFRAKSISKVGLTLHLNDGGYSAGRAKGTFLINSTLYHSAEINPTSTRTYYTMEWTTDPSTGQPWTAATIRALQFGLSLYRGSNCAKVQLVIEYEPKVPTRGSAIWW